MYENLVILLTLIRILIQIDRILWIRIQSIRIHITALYKHQSTLQLYYQCCTLLYSSCLCILCLQTVHVPWSLSPRMDMTQQQQYTWWQGVITLYTVLLEPRNLKFMKNATFSDIFFKTFKCICIIFFLYVDYIE